MTTNPATLPPYFVLYIPTRHNSSDPYAGFILVRTATSATRGYRLTPEPACSTPYRITRLSSVKKPIKRYTVSFDVADINTPKEVWNWANILQIKMSSGLQIPVLTVVGHSSIIQHGEKRNIMINPNSTQEGAQLSPPILPMFVARKLLELAQLKGESCPITVEEFVAGSTAVMSCGHLFTRLAITESFKVAANQCPACRLVGAPVFV
jgi:hypothetical protein